MNLDFEKLLSLLKSASFYRLLFIFGIILLVVYDLIYFFLKNRKQKESKILRPLRKIGRKALLNKIAFYIINPLLVIIIVLSGGNISFASPKVISPKGPAFGVYEITDQKPLLVQFDRPINSNLVEKSISPEIPGSWKSASKKYGVFTDSLLFYPEKTPAPETRYTVSLSKIKNIFGKTEKNYLFSFVSPSLPKIKETVPASGTEGILPGQELIVSLDEPHENTAKIEFATNPETAIEVTKKDERNYSIKAKDGFKKSTSYALSVFRTPLSYNFKTKKTEELGEKEEIGKLEFRTLEAPGVKDYSPKGSGILTDTKVVVEFKQDMDRPATERAFAVAPSVLGKLTWENNRKMTFNPASPFAKNTTYTVSVSKEARAADESPFEDNFSYSFTTIGPVGVSLFSPANNASGVGLDSAVSVTFNQAVDHASAQSKFSISPSVGGSFSWSGNKMIYSHGSFSYYTRYVVSIATGVKTVNGLDSVNPFSAAFTTKQQTVTLNVPSYRQVHMYSCMAAAARSALAYRGASVSEDHLLSLIGYDNTPFSGTWGDPNAIWGNPYSGTVGNIDGKSGGINWGYGAYWGPTAAAINHYRPTETKTGWNVQGLAAEIAAGNPVLIWWVNGVWPAYEVYWKTSSGQSIRGVNSMHVQVVKGFTGTVDNPTSFTVTDSGYGYPSRTYDVNTFKAKWGWFGNTGVIVR